MMREDYSKPTRCAECGAVEPGGPASYHPYAFCVLIKAGQDPREVVGKAMPHLPPLDDIGPPAPGEGDDLRSEVAA